jgi:hypothetical protein
MSCTNEDPCKQSMLRWVHSDKCKILTLSAERAELRMQVRTLQRASNDLLQRLSPGSTEGWGIWADNLRAVVAGVDPYIGTGHGI